MTNRTVSRDDISNAFRRVELNQTSTIGQTELSDVLQRLDPDVWTDEVLERLFDAANLNKDITVDYDEFLKWVYNDEIVHNLLDNHDVAHSSKRGSAEKCAPFKPRNVPTLRIEAASKNDVNLTTQMVLDCVFNGGDAPEYLQNVSTYKAIASMGGRDWRVNVSAVPCPQDLATGRVALFMHGHGHSCCISTWGRFWVPMIRKGFHLLAFDAPGFGRSEGACGQTLPWRDWDADLVLALLDAFRAKGQGRVTVFGQCMGGAMFLRALQKSEETFAHRHVLHNCTIGTWPKQLPEILKRKGGGVFSFWWLDPDHMRESNVYREFTALMASSPELCTFVDLQRDRPLPDFFNFGRVEQPNLARNDDALVLGYSADAVRELVDFVTTPPRARGCSTAPRKTMLQLGLENQNFKVFVRARPLLPREAHIPLGCDVNDVQDPRGNDVQQILIRQADTHAGRSLGEFVFERVFRPEATQDDVWEALRSSLDVVAALLTGIGATVFAYGQTGSGKTYTIDGEGSGIMARLIRDLYSRLTLGQEVMCTYVQLYNESFLDLFAPPNKLSQDGNGAVVGAYVQRSASAAELMDKIKAGCAFRASGRTNMNDASSRSHAILSLGIAGDTDHVANPEARLFVVDLAGSERVKRSGVTGAGLEEAVAINKSLLALSNVTKALVENDGRPRAHIPYRDSALTQLLRNSLGGDARTALVACVSPASDSIDETLGTLRFAACATHVQNRSEELKREAAAQDAEEKLETELQGNSVEFTNGEAWIPTRSGSIHCYGDLSAPADAPTIVMIHYYGEAVDGRMWDYMFDALRAAECRYLAPDMPGHGGSAGESSSKPEDYTKPNGPVDILLQIMDGCGLRKAIVMGYDWGGGVACAFALAHPARTQKLIVWCPSVRDPKALEKCRRRGKAGVLFMWARNDSWHPYRKGTELAASLGVKVTDVRCRHKGGGEDARTHVLRFLAEA